MGLNKTLEDFQMKNGKTLNNKMIHADIVDNKLVLTIDFDNPRISALQYLLHQGIDFSSETAEAIKNLIDMIVFPPIEA